MIRPRCACGCGARAANRHHVIYASELKRVYGSRPRSGSDEDRALWSLGRAALLKDARNLLWLAFACHQDHHHRAKVLPLSALPDSVFEFAQETLGEGMAYESLRRNYSGSDERLDALLGSWEAQAA